MTRLSFAAPAIFVVAALVAPCAGHAQTFKVAKYNIGGEGNTDYVVAEAGTGRVFVSRSTHVMVVDGATGKVLGDIPDTPRMHGIGLAPKSNHGFTPNAGDSTVTMFDLKTLAAIKKIKIPTGTQTGTVFRIKGKGMPVLGGRGRGDLFVSVSVVTPTSLTREQRKLLEQLAVVENKDLEDKGLVDKVRDIFG